MRLYLSRECELTGSEEKPVLNFEEEPLSSRQVFISFTLNLESHSLKNGDFNNIVMKMNLGW